MRAVLEHIHEVERDLVIEEGFSPLDRLFPNGGQVGAQFHACVARQASVSERLDVHAMLAWQGQAPEDLRARTESLRRCLEQVTAHFGGQVTVTLFLVASSSEEAAHVDVALRGLEQGHFLEKIQFAFASVDSSGGQVHIEGRFHPDPGPDWFEEHFVSGGRHSDEEMASAQEARELDETRSRRFLSRSGGRPWATYSLIGLNVFVFIATLALAGDLFKQMAPAGLDAQTDGMLRAQSQQMAMKVMGANEGDLVFGQGQFWRLFASLFLHADIMHLLMNMAALYSLGSLVERFAGATRMILIYLCAGLLGSTLSAWRNFDIPAVGASGAILGLAGAMLALHWRRPKGFPRMLAERLYGSLLKPVAFIFVLGVGLSLFNSRLLFDNWAHLGGLGGGFGLAFFFPTLLKGRSSKG